MHFSHALKIWEHFPKLVPGVLVFHGIHPNVEAEGSVEPWYEQARRRVAQKQESEMPEISAWRKAYSQMGLKPTKYRSAAEALLRRFRRENDLPRLHPLVDLCNAVSIAFALPVAVFDLDRVEGFLEVRHAQGTEEYLAFNGQKEQPAPGEIIFCDAANRAHARRWTFRQSRHSIVTPETKSVLLISEGLHETAGVDVPTLMDAVAEGITALWSPPKCKAILTAKIPRVEF